MENARKVRQGIASCSKNLAGTLLTEWNTTVGNQSLTDQLVFMTDHNFALIEHTYMIVEGIIVCMDSKESVSDKKSRQLPKAASKS